MIELKSNELDYTTNMRQIFDRLPDPLQTKWRKLAKLYRERTDGRKPTRKELSAFITGESQTENDPVHGRSSTPTARVGSGNRSKKQSFMLKPAGGAPITTMSAEGALADASINLGTGEVLSVEDDPVTGSDRIRIACKVCEGKHRNLRCSVFPTKSFSWWRWFARSNALCYRCLSTSHVRKKCTEKNGCTEKDCAHPLRHHSLLHARGVTPREVKETERNVDQSVPARTDLTENNAAMEDSKRSFVLLKVVPLSIVADNGAIVTTYGLLDTAAVNSMWGGQGGGSPGE